jgi:hypothetical protein
VAGRIPLSGCLVDSLPLLFNRRILPLMTVHSVFRLYSRRLP